MKLKDSYWVRLVIIGLLTYFASLLVSTAHAAGCSQYAWVFLGGRWLRICIGY